MESLFGINLSWELNRTAENAFGSAVEALLKPTLLFQLVLLALAIVAGRLVGARIEAALEPRIREIRGRRRLLRLLAILLRRTRAIVSVLSLVVAIIVMRAVAPPGDSALLVVAASLIAAWVAISVLSRWIRNPTIARVVAWIAWLLVALQITSLADEAAGVLDAAALQMGELRISLYDIVQATFVVVIVLWGAMLAGSFIERRVSANADLTPSIKVLIGKLARIVLLIAALAIGLAALGIDLTALTVFTGALGVGIGIGLQKVVSNFVSGIIILLDKSIKPGDTISLGDTYGWVKALRARFVSVITRDGHSYLIPNEDFITQRVVSWSFTETLVRLDVEFGVAYSSDPHNVRRVAADAAVGVDRVQRQPKPVCHLTKLNDFTIDFVLRFWIVDPQNGVTNVRGAVLLALWDAFKAAEIEFAFPHSQIVVERPIDVRLSRASRRASPSEPPMGERSTA